MKMMSSTSITSTSGTTLISASVVETRRLRPRRPVPVSAAGCTLGMKISSHGPAKGGRDARRTGASAEGSHRHHAPPNDRTLADRYGSSKVSLRDVQKFHREVVHLRGEQL